MLLIYLAPTAPLTTHSPTSLLFFRSTTISKYINIIISNVTATNVSLDLKNIAGHVLEKLKHLVLKVKQERISKVSVRNYPVSSLMSNTPKNLTHNKRVVNLTILSTGSIFNGSNVNSRSLA